MTPNSTMSSGIDSTRLPHTEPTLVRVARAGDLKAVADILQASAPTRAGADLDSVDPHNIFPAVLNEAKVWEDIVERDYENVYSWYEDTPLIAAARNGDVEIVKLLLDTGYCDPTLESCPVDDVYETALVATRKKIEQVAKLAECQEQIKRSCRDCSTVKTPNDPVEKLAARHHADILSLMGRYKKVEALLETSLEFWDKASYSSPHAGSRTVFSNKMRSPAKKTDDDASISAEEYDALIHEHKAALSSALESKVKEMSIADKGGDGAATEDTPVMEPTAEPFVGGA